MHSKFSSFPIINSILLVFDKLITKFIFFIISLVFCFIKGFYPLWRYTSIFTKIYFLFSIIVFLKYCIKFKFKFLYKSFIFPILFMLVFFASIIFNDIVDRENLITAIVIYFTNLLVFMPIYPDQYNKSIVNEFNILVKLCLLLIFSLMIFSVIIYIYNILNNKLEFGARMYGIFQHANYGGWYSLFGIIAAFHLMKSDNDSNKNTKYFYVIICFILFIMLLLTKCRSALGTLFLLFATSIINKFKSKKIILSIIIFIFILFLVYIFKLRGMYGRMEVYEFFLRSFDMHNKLIGSGYAKILKSLPNDYLLLIKQFPYLSPAEEHSLTCNTHNIFLHQLVVHGIFGFIIFASYIVYIIVNCLHTYTTINLYNDDERNMFKTAFCYIFAVLCIGMVDDVLLSNIIMFNNVLFFISTNYILIMRSKRNI